MKTLLIVGVVGIAAVSAWAGSVWGGRAQAAVWRRRFPAYPYD